MAAAKELGGVEVLAKPFHLDGLRAALQRLLGCSDDGSNSTPTPNPIRVQWSPPQ